MTRSQRSPHCKRGDHLTCQAQGSVPACECSCHATIVTRPSPTPTKGPRRSWAKRTTSTLERPALTKEQAACCQALVDDLGRPPIGFCSPACLRRPA